MRLEIFETEFFFSISITNLQSDWWSDEDHGFVLISCYIFFIKEKKGWYI